MAKRRKIRGKQAEENEEELGDLDGSDLDETWLEEGAEDFGGFASDASSESVFALSSHPLMLEVGFPNRACQDGEPN